MAQAPGKPAVNAQADMIRQNLQLRQALLQSAPRMRKSLGSFNGAVGGSTRVKLFNVGITTHLTLEIILPVTIGTAAASLSPKAPYNLIDRVKLQDFDGTDRVSCSGYQLWVLNSNRAQVPAGLNNGALPSILPTPAAPTGTGAQTIRFFIDVPLAYNPRTDLRGALLTQTAVGESHLTLNWNSILYENGNADAVFNGAATTTVTPGDITVKVHQHYLLPQSVGGNVPIPQLDIMTVYEIAGAVRTSDNLSAGNEKLFNYPNLRSVIGAYYNYINGGVMNEAYDDIARFRLVANGNNVLREYENYDKLNDQRQSMIISADLKPGTYIENHREKPIETALFGNVQYGITPSDVQAGNTNFEVMYESFYTKGSTLPGINQG